MRQLFGVIRSDKPEFHTMICFDSDQSNVATIHWWRINEGSQAITFELKPAADGRLDLIPKSLYRSDENDGLFLPNLTPEEFNLLKIFTGHLIEHPDGGYSGEWEFGEDNRGTIVFFPELPLFKNQKLEPKICDSWESFKQWASDLRSHLPEWTFRGHGNNTWPLSTTIHRAGRTRLERYYHETIHLFRVHAEVALGREFELLNSSEYSTLLGLAQHHGLPTPLLDITDSPYVAAYFAFADAVENKRPTNSFVRIYAISEEYLKENTKNSIPLACGRPYVKPLTVSPRHNPRLYAQQGRFLVTNIVDVEAYLLVENRNRNNPILLAADVPVKCAADALQDLKYMGLTAGSLFPGLDGVSRMIKQMMMVNDTRHQLELLPIPDTQLSGQ